MSKTAGLSKQSCKMHTEGQGNHALTGMCVKEDTNYSPSHMILLVQHPNSLGSVMQRAQAHHQ